jgi:nucleotide-binding universal stress UspA family protein
VADVGGADPVLGPTLTIASRHGATVHLVHTYVPPDTAQGLGLGAMDYSGLAGVTPLWGGVEAWDLAGALEERLRGQIARLDIGADVRVHVVAGSAAGAIADAAEECDADLIVVGATQRGGLERAFLGTTAGAVLQQALAPVLVLRQALPSSGGRVLLTTDLSQLSRDVCITGIALARGLLEPGDIQLACLHVHAPVREADEDHTARGGSEPGLHALLRAVTPPSTSIEPIIRRGVPVDEIAATAAAWRADLVVLGTHARRGVARFVLGSVAETAVRQAPCNTLVVPPFSRGEDSDF